MILPVISDVDKVAEVSLALITVKHHPRLPEHALKLWAGLVESVAAVQDLNDENAEVLLVVALDGHGHGLDELGAGELHLPPPELRGPGSDTARVLVTIHRQAWTRDTWLTRYAISHIPGS